MQGKIVRLIRGRGFGFIRTPRAEEFFFHASGVRDGNFDQLQEGDLVTFDPEPDRQGRGRRAVHVAPAFQARATG